MYLSYETVMVNCDFIEVIVTSIATQKITLKIAVTITS